MSKFAASAAILALSLIGAHAFAQTQPQVQPAAPPPGPGFDLINQRCGFCHSTAQVFAQHKSGQEWAATVQAMADRGAEVSPDEVKVIADYLAKNYPAAPATGQAHN
jgi:cytochrome c5